MSYDNASKREPAPAALRPASASPRQRKEERGVIIIWALLTAFMVAGIVISATEEIRAVDKAAAFEFSANGQAEEVAQAGLVDAYAWFRRQEQQPVKGFEPKGLPPSLREEDTLPGDDKMPEALRGNASSAAARTQNNANSAATGQDGSAGRSADAPGQQKAMKTVAEVEEQMGADAATRVETELAAATYYSLDMPESEIPELGLVRSFQISPGVWARYTVSKGSGAEPYDDANENALYDLGESFTDVNGDGKWNAGQATRDVSSARGIDASGSVWYVTSIGEIFKRPSPELPLGAGDNVRIGRSVWGTEFRRLTINPPASAAICVQNASEVELGDNCRVRGNTALAYAEGSGEPAANMEGVKGGMAGMPEYDTSSEAVFGLPWTKLMSMADISTGDAKSGIPTQLPTGGLIVVRGGASFDKSRPLRGRAIVAVEGDVVIEDGSASFFEGILYVNGDLVVRGPATLRGTVIVTGHVDARGSGSDYVTVAHDGPLVSKLLQKVAQYRHSKAPFRIKPKLDEGLLGAPGPNPGPNPDPGPGPGPDKSEKSDPSGKSDKSGPCAGKSDKSNKSAKSGGSSNKSGKSKGSSGKSGKSGGSSNKSGKSGGSSGKSGKSGGSSNKSGKSGGSSGKSAKSGGSSNKSGKSGGSSGKSAKSGGSSNKSGKSGKSGSPDGEMEPKGGCDGHDKKSNKSAKSNKSGGSSGKSGKSGGSSNKSGKS